MDVQYTFKSLRDLAEHIDAKAQAIRDDIAKNSSSYRQAYLNNLCGAADAFETAARIVRKTTLDSDSKSESWR